MKYLLLFFFCIIHSSLYSQNGKVREYKISMIGSPQVIFLIEENNINYNGYITSQFFKPRKRFLGITLKKSGSVLITETLSPEIVKKTMIELRSNGIEQLKKCEEDEQCKKNNFLDGDNLVFEIISNEKNLKADFQEVHPETFKKAKIETTSLRRQAQILITLADKIIDIENEFRKTLKKIKRPYCYSCSGISNCCIE